MLVKELRKLLETIPDDMPVGVAYPEGSPKLSVESADIRAACPVSWFDGVKKDVFVIHVY